MVRISLWDEEEYKRNPKQKNCMLYCDDAPNDYMLRDGGKSKSFTWRFHESLR